MIQWKKSNRVVRVLTCAAAVAAAFGMISSAWADKDDDKDKKERPEAVIVKNVPLPVTGNVNATLSGPITGTVNANVTSLPAVQVSSMPPVSLTLPAQPFFDEITLLNGGDKKAVGVVGARLGVTTLTISNFDSNPQQLFVFNPAMSGPDCSGSVLGGSVPIARALLDARKTVQLQFPTPMVFSLGGLGCIAAEVTTNLTGGSVAIGVVGFATP